MFAFLSFLLPLPVWWGVNVTVSVYSCVCAFLLLLLQLFSFIMIANATYASLFMSDGRCCQTLCGCVCVKRCNNCLPAHWKFSSLLCVCMDFMDEFIWWQPNDFTSCTLQRESAKHTTNVDEMIHSHKEIVHLQFRNPNGQSALSWMKWVSPAYFFARLKLNDKVCFVFDVISFINKSNLSRNHCKRQGERTKIRRRKEKTRKEQQKALRNKTK